MQLFVRFDGTQTVSVDVEPNVHYNVLYEAVTSALGVKDISLNLGGRPFPQDGLISELEGLRAGVTIDAAVGLPGGKVHGSLARAGKVKAQTPKVAAAEDKKKKKNGRAKRRQQYNRRFVNVVVGVGKRRGPNANVSA